MIVIGGLADIPDLSHGGTTPLMHAYTPALDALAKCGCVGTLDAVPQTVEARPENALLSMLGHDFNRGCVPAPTLRALGTGRKPDPSDLRWFVIPKFSGHGVVITDDPVARGVGMSALLRPVFTVDGATGRQKENPCGTLADKAQAAIRAIETFDFVLIYVDTPRTAALEGDFDAKAAAIEEIDAELINPVADYVWNAKVQMNMVVASGIPTSWRMRADVAAEIPAVVYFNDDLPYETEKFDEQSVAEGPLNAPLPGDLIRLLVSFEPLPEK